MVCEPVHRFEPRFPRRHSQHRLLRTHRLGAVVETPDVHGSWATATGEILASRMLQLQQQLRGLTRGEGVLEAEFDRYAPVGDGRARS